MDLYVIQLIYTSAATAPFTAESLRALLVRARDRNITLDVSGMLLHVSGTFLQVLEGEPAIVDALYDRIRADPRHVRALTLARTEIATRNFPDWSMGFFDGSNRVSTLVGYRASTGFGDLLGDIATLTRIVRDFRDGRWSSIAA